MTNVSKTIIGLALCAALAPFRGAAEAAAPPPTPNLIQRIGVDETAGGVELAIRGSRAPSYTVFKLQDPPRLVVDLAGADVSSVTAPIAVRKAGVREVTTAQYRDAKSAVGRVIVGLDPAARYEVFPRGDAVVVKVALRDAPAEAAAAPAAVAAAPTPVAPAAEPAPARAAPAAPQAAPGDNVVARRVEEAEVSRPATAVTGARAGRDGVTLALDGQVGRVEIIELQNPPRLALDLYGVARAPRHAVALQGAFTQARFGRDAGKVRVVLDAAGDLPRCDVKRVAGGLVVVARAEAAAAPAETARVEAPAPEPRPAAHAAAQEQVAVHTAPAPAPRAEERAERPRVVISQTEAAGFTGEAPSYAMSGAPQKREYTGRRITLDFHDIDLRNLLRLIADVSKKNIIVADDVQGKITVSLRNVPWDQALDLVLKSKGLDKEELGNVVRIAKVEQLANERKARAAALEAMKPTIPLKVRIIPVNFARANDLSARVKDVLSERGTASVDERTNVLIVKDTQEALARAEGLVRNLDTETPQVRIESRIVEAGSSASKAIGVQWGGTAAFTQAMGNPTGLVFPNNVTAAGASGNSPSDGTSSTPNYVVNLPAAIGQGSGGGIGFQFGSVGGAFNLNLRLSALENSGQLKTISAPSVSTIDNKEATIGQGVSIPFSQVSASGVNTTFVEARLELKVTPHVSADGSVLMKIKVTNNQPNPNLTGANGQPSISKREAETEALVKDGDTTVIGGIYTRATATATSEVPFFSKIPILGFFFRTKSDSDQNTELLVFITPHILNRPTATAAGAQ